MLNKLLSNLPFNPSLIGQISFYAKRLKKETTVRRLGFIMLALAMLIQLFAAMSPPHPSLATSDNNLVYDGFDNSTEAYMHCKNTAEDYSIILNYYGISCDDVANRTTPVMIGDNDRDGQLYSMGRNPQGFASEEPVTIPGANGGNHLYFRYLWEWGSKTYPALHGTTASGVEFYLLDDCGNLVFVGTPPAPVATPTPTPAPSTPVNQPSIGNLEAADCTQIAGWAFDQDVPTTSLTVHIYIDGQGAAITQANLSRPDVAAAFPGAGNYHGFRIDTPGSIKNSSAHRIDAYAISLDASGNQDGINPLIGTKIVTLGTCTTPPPFTQGSANCSGLRAIDLTHRAYTFIAGTKGVNYTPKSYTFNFGDGSANDVQTTSVGTATADHVYSQAGTYTAKVSIVLSIRNTATTTITETSTCQTTITITPTTTTITPCKEVQSSNNQEVCLVPHKTATNISRGGTNANGKTAHAGETIEYTLSDKNVGSVTIRKHVIRESVSDILDYADITDLHGGTLDKYKFVSWPAANVKAGQTMIEYLTVRIKNPIPNTPASSSDPGHFDHRMINVYGDTIIIKLPGSVASVTQHTNATLVNTGPGTGMVAIVSLTVVVGYFFARSRLLSEEIDIVRTDYAPTGGL